jgi:hypothetical protein
MAKSCNDGVTHDVVTRGAGAGEFTYAADLLDRGLVHRHVGTRQRADLLAAPRNQHELGALALLVADRHAQERERALVVGKVAGQLGQTAVALAGEDDLLLALVLEERPARRTAARPRSPTPHAAPPRRRRARACAKICCSRAPVGRRLVVADVVVSVFDSRTELRHSASPSPSSSSSRAAPPVSCRPPPSAAQKKTQKKKSKNRPSPRPPAAERARARPSVGRRPPLAARRRRRRRAPRAAAAAAPPPPPRCASTATAVNLAPTDERASGRADARASERRARPTARARACVRACACARARARRCALTEKLCALRAARRVSVEPRDASRKRADGAAGQRRQRPRARACDAATDRRRGARSARESSRQTVVACARARRVKKLAQRPNSECACVVCARRARVVAAAVTARRAVCAWPTDMRRFFGSRHVVRDADHSKVRGGGGGARRLAGGGWPALTPSVQSAMFEANAVLRRRNEVRRRRGRSPAHGSAQSARPHLVILEGASGCAKHDIASRLGKQGFCVVKAPHFLQVRRRAARVARSCVSDQRATTTKTTTMTMTTTTTTTTTTDDNPKDCGAHCRATRRRGPSRRDGAEQRRVARRRRALRGGILRRAEAGLVQGRVRVARQSDFLRAPSVDWRLRSGALQRRGRRRQRRVDGRAGASRARPAPLQRVAGARAQQRRDLRAAPAGASVCRASFASAARGGTTRGESLTCAIKNRDLAVLFVRSLQAHSSQAVWRRRRRAQELHAALLRERRAAV